MPKVAIIIYSTYGHIKILAEAVQKGLKESGIDAPIFRVAETLSDEVFGKLGGVKFEDVPILEPNDLANYDAFLFGIPTRYGTPPAQVKAFWDATGQLWAKGALAGKYAGVFTSTATQHGGQETTIITFIPHLIHHSINFVPLGYTSTTLFDNTEVLGGGPWGAGTITNSDGSRLPSDKEKQIATDQGKHFASVILKVFKDESSEAAPAEQKGKEPADKPADKPAEAPVEKAAEKAEEKPVAAAAAASASAATTSSPETPKKGLAKLFSRFSVKKKNPQ